MSLVEHMFQIVHDRLQSKRAAASSKNAVMTEMYKERLTHFARFLYSYAVTIEGASDGWGLVGQTLYTPYMIDVFNTTEENYDVLKFRIVTEYLATREILTGKSLPDTYLCQEFIRSLHLENSVDKAMSDFITSVSTKLTALNTEKRSQTIKDLLTFSSPKDANHHPVTLEFLKTRLNSSEKQGDDATNLKLSPKSRHIQQVKLSSEDMNPLMHVFEKIQTLEDYSGGNKPLDGTDELEEHARALQDLNLNAVVRTDQPGAGFVSGPVETGAGVEPFMPTDSAVKTRYHEWHGGKCKYLREWCTVLQQAASSGTFSPDDFRHCQQRGRELEQRLRYYFNSYRWKRRQIDGVEFDLDSFLDNRVEQLRGGQPDGAIYMNQRKTNLSFALTVLCDSSLSTESWVAGKQVMSIIQEAVVTLSYALANLDCLWSVAGFRSYTRNECHYNVLKEFSDSSEVLQKTLGSLKPDGYTRIGPALRHAGHLLEDVRAKRKMLIVITDAKPTDYDYYDGSYGAKDVRKAVAELKTKNIVTQAIAISEGSKKRAVEMFGSATSTCTSSDQLGETLFCFFAGVLDNPKRTIK